MDIREINIRYREYGSMEQLSPEDRELAEAALKAAGNAYTPYSHFNVGAAIRLSGGEIVTGSMLRHNTRTRQWRHWLWLPSRTENYARFPPPRAEPAAR